MNLIKGWVTTLLGLAIMIIDGMYFFGYIHLPNPNYVPKPVQILLAFFVGLILFVMPATWLEDQLKKISDKLTGKI